MSKVHRRDVPADPSPSPYEALEGKAREILGPEKSATVTGLPETERKTAILRAVGTAEHLLVGRSPAYIEGIYEAVAKQHQEAQAKGLGTQPGAKADFEDPRDAFKQRQREKAHAISNGTASKMYSSDDASTAEDADNDPRESFKAAQRAKGRGMADRGGGR